MIWNRTVIRLRGTDVVAIDMREELRPEDKRDLESRLRIVYDLMVERRIYARLLQLGPMANIHPQPTEPTERKAGEISDAEALDKLNLLLSAPTWPGASALEDVCAIVRSTGRSEVEDAPAWEAH